MLRKLIIASAFLAGCVWLFAGNIKTVDGVARANIKTLDGVASANLKTLNGVDATYSAIVCSGTWASGDTERFENAENSYCTTGPAQTDAGGVLLTYDTAQYVTGTHSMSVTNTGTESDAWTLVDFGSGTGDDDASMRFYFRTPALFASDAQTMNIAQVGNSTSSDTSDICYLRLGRWSGALRLDIRGATNTDGMNLSAETWYRVELDINRNSTCTLRVFAIGGTQVGSDVTCTGADFNGRYWIIGQLDTNFNGSQVIYFDNWTFGSTGGVIGADE